MNTNNFYNQLKEIYPETITSKGNIEVSMSNFLRIYKRALDKYEDKEVALSMTKLASYDRENMDTLDLIDLNVIEVYLNSKVDEPLGLRGEMQDIARSLKHIYSLIIGHKKGSAMGRFFVKEQFSQFQLSLDKAESNELVDIENSVYRMEKAINSIISMINDDNELEYSDDKLLTKMLEDLSPSIEEFNKKLMAISNKDILGDVLEHIEYLQK